MSKSSTGKLAIGSRVRIREGVTSPDFSDVSFAGWTATIMELSGKKPKQKFILAFDDAVIAAMPPDYLQRCEEQRLLYTMACLEAEQLEAL
ncbi:MAG: hypothetical protein ACKV2Q_26700 [Planctomycetaceae bacterium]